MKSLLAAGSSLLTLLMIMASSISAAAQQHRPDVAAVETPAGGATKNQDAVSHPQSASQDNAGDIPMEHKHMDMGPHMYITGMHPPKPGDQRQAGEVLQTARKVMDQYRDYKAALRDGFEI